MRYTGNSDPILTALAAIDERGNPDSDENTEYRVRNIVKARTRRREIVNRFMFRDYWQLMAWLSEPAPRRFLSCDEALTFFRRQRARFWWAKRTGHYSQASRAASMSACRDRIVIARYFAKHGRELWAREAA
jgi:hypothetical protein